MFRGLLQATVVGYALFAPMKRFLIWFLVQQIFTALAARADEEMSPVPMVTPSESQMYFFKMVPAEMADRGGDRLVEVTKATGAAYQLGGDGGMRELWRTEGWYASTVLLANDGRHLVRMGPWPSGWEPTPEHLAVAFYRDGQLLRSYSTADLIKDKKRVQVSASHYFWLAVADHSDWFRFDPDREPRLDNNYGEFRLKTIEGVLYRFSLESGKIIGEVPPPKPSEWASEKDIQRIGLTLPLVPLPIKLDELDSAVGLLRIVGTSFAMQGSTVFRTLAITPPDDPKGYYGIDLQIGDYQVAKDGVPAAGHIDSMQLVFLSPTGYKFSPKLSTQMKRFLEQTKASIRQGETTPREAVKRFLETLNVSFGDVAR